MTWILASSHSMNFPLCQIFSVGLIAMDAPYLLGFTVQPKRFEGDLLGSVAEALRHQWESYKSMKHRALYPRVSSRQFLLSACKVTPWLCAGNRRRVTRPAESAAAHASHPPSRSDRNAGCPRKKYTV